MRIARLAQIFELKHNLQSQGASIQDVINGVKENILTVFRMYIDPKTITSKSYGAVPVFAEQGEPHCKKIMEQMYTLVAKLDVLAANPPLLFRAVNTILGTVSELDGAIKQTRSGKSPEFIPTQQVLNKYRHELKKLEESLKRISSILVKQAKVLQKFLPSETELSGDVVVPERMPLSKEKLRMFTLTPAAQTYGLDDIVLLEKFLDTDPEMRELITTLINAIDRGRVPKDGPEVAAVAKSIKQRLKEQTTNLPALEQTPENPPAPVSLFEEPKETE